MLIRGKKPDKVNILRYKWKGERNAMFIVALYLVIKEHKICLRLFLSEHSLMMFFPSFFFTLSWVGGVIQPCHMHPPFFFSFGPTPPSSSFPHVHWYLSVFAPPAYFCPVLTPHLSLSSVPAECEHIWETLLAFTNVDKFLKRLNSCTMLLQSKQNTFQSLLQFCKKCVHFCFFASH